MNGKSGHHIGKELQAMFPEQTKSIPALLVWTVIYLLDVAFVIWVWNGLGIPQLDANMNDQAIMIALWLLAALGLFKVETFVYHRIVSLFR